MTTPTTDGLKKLLATIGDYTGKKVEWISVYADPLVKGTFAIRACVPTPRLTQFAMGVTTIDFLVMRMRDVADIEESDLEEVEFTHWPPQQREVHRYPAAEAAQAGVVGARGRRKIAAWQQTVSQSQRRPGSVGQRALANAKRGLALYASGIGDASLYQR